MKILLSLLIPTLMLVSVALPAAPTDGLSRDQLMAAAKAGDPDAQLETGILYEYGFGMPDNLVPALAWYMVAADQGNEKAAALRDKLMQRLSKADVDQARSLSQSLVTRAPAARQTDSEPVLLGPPADSPPADSADGNPAPAP